MRMIRRLYSLLALLLVGSAGLRAQSSDPFPDVESHKYENNMIIRGQVRQNGVALGNDAVVAVYCGDEIRGKDRPFSDKNHTNIFQFVVHGDGNTNGDPLIFKVYTGGKIIEVDQGLTYQNNGEIGSYDNYYYIDLGLRGDANGDGSVSVTDIAVVVNSILQLPNSVFSFYGADANGDGSVTVTDIGVIVDIILGHNSNANARKWEDTPEPQ